MSKNKSKPSVQKEADAQGLSPETQKNLKALKGLGLMRGHAYDDKSKTLSVLIDNYPAAMNRDVFTTSDDGLSTVISNNANENRRYVQWGQDNALPFEILSRSINSPYVAPSIKFNIDSTYSQGVKLWYVYHVYEGGEMKRKQMEYEAAGEYLRARIRELDRASSKAGVLSSANAEEIAKLRADLATWEATWAELSVFTEENDLDTYMLQQASDFHHFGITFPLLKMNFSKTKPRIKMIEHLDATITRLGEMDAYGRIPHVVYSRSFDQDTFKIRDDATMKHTVYSAVEQARAVVDLRNIQKDDRGKGIKDKRVSICMPLKFPSPGKPYYPRPAWWSIFYSGMYQYMMSMFLRRMVMMDNASTFAHIIHLSEEFVRHKQVEAGATTPEENQAVYNKLAGELLDFMSNKKNQGKDLVAIMKYTPDGKPMKWVEVESIDNSKPVSDVKEDIEEIANVILYPLEIHPQTVGAIPGKNKQASGSEARELWLLKQTRLFPVKVILLKPLYAIKHFNAWDSHLHFEIPNVVLTTLDKNKQGIETQSTQQ